MPWKVNIFFYLSIGFSIIGFTFPTHVTEVYLSTDYFSTYIGEMVHWIHGYYILMPWDPTEEIIYYFNSNLTSLNIQSHFLILGTLVLHLVSYIVLHNAKLGKRWGKYPVYIIAFIQLIACQYYESFEFFLMHLSIWGFIFSGYFAIMWNRELNFFYRSKSIEKVKNKNMFNVVLKSLNLILRVFLISSLLFFLIQDSEYGFSLFSFIEMLPASILLLLMIIYEIFSLVRVKKSKKEKMTPNEIIN